MKQARTRRTVLFALLLLLGVEAGPLLATPCVVPDNGSGTITLPPAGCDYSSPDEIFLIIDGLPPGTTIELDGPLGQFNCDGAAGVCSLGLGPGVCEAPGGSLGGDGHCFSATLDFALTGTGDLAGYTRQISIPVEAEAHTGPRTPGDPVQTFAIDMFRLQGLVFGDPDFDLLQITFGTDLGLPSPGQTTLTQLPNGDFAVDSFFDITYQINFMGAPGSILEGLSGTTTGSIRIQTEPLSPDCLPLPDSSGCLPVVCPVPNDDCSPRCANLDPTTGITLVTECGCRGSTEWGLTVDNGLQSNVCLSVDDGTGTITLPPAGCDYLSPDDVYRIIDGLPPGTTIELDGPLGQFICDGATGVCGLGLAQGVCEAPGGSLGGDGHCFSATLDFTLTGTGSLAGYTRQISIPVEAEAHTGPRTPGDPEQIFPTDMFRVQGEVFGDPDFDLLQVTFGTDYGLPSPGQTTLNRLPSGDFAVDSFFDISYQIEFVGAPGSALEGLAGSTTAAIRIETGNTVPSCSGACPPNTVCGTEQVTRPDGTFDVCCVMTPEDPPIFADGFESGNTTAWAAP